MKKAYSDLLRRLTLRLGAPLQVDDDLHIWRTCPVCGGGDTDPQQLWRPLMLRPDGAISCSRCLSPRSLILASLTELDEVAYWRDRAHAAEQQLAASGDVA